MTTLLLTHTKYGLLETLRIPIVVVSVIVLPSLSFVFFALPNISDDPAGATASTVGLSVFAAMLICLFQFGAGIAEERQLPWDPYLRTLPVRPWQRLGGRLMVALPFALVAVLPLVVLAWTTTNADPGLLRVVAGLGALLIGSLPLALLGVALGNALPSKAAIAVANLLLLPFAFLGGLFVPPDFLPDIVQTVSPFVPTRGWLEIVMLAVTGQGGIEETSSVALVSWCVWLAIAAGLALWAYRREEARYR